MKRKTLDSCGRSGTAETPQAVSRVGSAPSKEELLFEKSGSWVFSLFFPGESCVCSAMERPILSLPQKTQSVIKLFPLPNLPRRFPH
mgnify:CR=1 FL=1